MRLMVLKTEHDCFLFFFAQSFSKVGCLIILFCFFLHMVEHSSFQSHFEKFKLFDLLRDRCHIFRISYLFYGKFVAEIWPVEVHTNTPVNELEMLIISILLHQNHPMRVYLDVERERERDIQLAWNFFLFLYSYRGNRGKRQMLLIFRFYISGSRIPEIRTMKL